MMLSTAWFVARGGAQSLRDYLGSMEPTHEADQVGTFLSDLALVPEMCVMVGSFMRDLASTANPGLRL